MLQLWVKIKKLLRGRVEQRVTLGGLAFTMVILLVGIAAFISANNLLFLLLAAMLATLLVSGFVNRLSLSGLQVEFLLPEHLSARRKTTARLLVRNVKKGIPSFSIHLTGTADSALAGAVYFPVLPGNSRLDELVEVRFERRGRYLDNSFQFSSRFPFGLTERRVNVTLRGDVVVYPCVDPRPGFDELFSELSGEIEAHYRGRGHDFYRIRPYEALESARHLDWKATAHTGELQVREFAREQEQLVLIALDLNVPDAAADWFERAVDCCAFLTVRLTERGARLRIRTQDFDVVAPDQGDIYTILRYLALVAPMAGRPPLSPDEEKSFILVFTPDGARWREAGWNSARLFDLAALPPVGPKRSG